MSEDTHTEQTEPIGSPTAQEFQIGSEESVSELPLTQSSVENVDAPGEEHTPTEEELNPVLALFMSACQNGDLPTVTELVSSGQVQSSDTFSQGITGLHWAAINNRLSVVKYLMENEHSRADPNKLGGNLLASPLHWACRNGLVYVVDYLLTHTDADPTLRDSQQYNALHLAVHSSNITLVVYILLKCVAVDKSIYIDEQDNIGCTPLHWAAYQGDILTVNALLKYGADVGKLDKSLMTPLHWAFIRGYKSVLAALLEGGSDIFAKNDKGKDSFGVAADMNCEKTWLQVLREADRSEKRNWEPNHHLLSQKLAKILTFGTPFVTLPLVFHICSFNKGYAIPKIFLSFAIFALSIVALQKFVIPIYLRKDKALFQSPFLAGVFSASAFWCVVTWLTTIMPLVWIKKFFVNTTFALTVGIVAYTFTKAMTINPGFVPVPSDPNVVFEQVKDLIKTGRFDTEHFCVNSFIRKPLRSKYSRLANRLIARFDHSCPWVYNDIGVRNHKLFVVFTYSLAVAIVTYSILAIKFFDKFADKLGYDSDAEGECKILSEHLCEGYVNNHFIFNVLFWSWFQLTWVSSLCVVQTFQILRGVTTWEFSSLNKQMGNPMYNHSTVPSDFDGPSAPTQLQNSPGAAHGHRHGGVNACMRLLGMDQFFMTVKIAVLSLFKSTTHSASYTSMDNIDVPTDFGWKQNWLDFWFLGDTEWRNLFYLPIDGENNLNGSVVDYYKLFEYPSKHSGSDAV